MSADSKEELEKKKAQKKLFGQARNFLRKNTNLNNIAAHYKQIYVDVDIEDQLDSNKDLLAVKNGIIDLQTGVLREGHIDDFCFTQLDTIYEELSQTTIIENFLDSIFDSDQPTIDYVQKLFGYGITGRSSEHCWIMLTGTGRNGKSLWISLIESLLEKLCVTAASEVFFKGDRGVSAGGPAQHLVELKGSRICVKEEAEPKSKLNSEMLKIITGESRVTARGVHEKKYENFMPTMLPILLCNHKPPVDIEDSAMMERIKVVPFNMVFTSPNDLGRPFDENNPTHRLKDPSLKDKLLTPEAQQQLLTWLVRGAVKWYKEGLGPQPQSMKDAYSTYRCENDFVKNFVNEYCELPPPDTNKCELKAYFANGTEFLKMLNLSCTTKFTQKALKEKMLEDYGVKYGHQWNSNEKGYIGIRIVS